MYRYIHDIHAVFQSNNLKKKLFLSSNTLPGSDGLCSSFSIDRSSISRRSETNRGHNHGSCSIRIVAVVVRWTTVVCGGRSTGDARGAGRRTDGGRESRRKRRGELALFYRKGLIALPITDNATINDLREVGVGEWRKGGKDRRGEAGKRDRDGDRDVVENGNESWESGCGGGGGRERWKEAIRAYIRVARCTTQVKGGKQEEQSARVKGGKRTIRAWTVVQRRAHRAACTRYRRMEGRVRRSPVPLRAPIG